MSLGRFLLSLNHDEPEVVMRGLTEFRQQVVEENRALAEYGYYGRQCGEVMSVDNVLLPDMPPVSGLVAEYFHKSPQLEELFVLWDLPNRDEHKALCAAHMATLAVILHFGKPNLSVCTTAISRILSEHLKSLHSQLASGNTDLIHSTLALLLAMVRTSPQNCKDVFQKLNLSSQNLDAVVQKGKTVNWKCGRHDHALTTDSRLFVIMIVCIALRNVDEVAALELFAERSLMRKIMHSVGRDSPETLQVVLPGVLQAIALNPVMAAHVHDVFDAATVRQLVLLYDRPEESVQAFGHSFALQLVERMKHLQTGTKRAARAGGSAQSVNPAVSISRACSYLAQHLEPHADPRQQEVLAALLSYQPHLLGKSIASLSALKSWEPVPSTEYLGVVRYLSQLLQSAAIDHKVRAQLRAAFGGAHGADAAAVEDGAEDPFSAAPVAGANAPNATHTSQAQQALLSNLLNSWLPPGLTKKDISKMLSHKELSLQRAGLQLALSLAQRLQRALREAGVSSSGGGSSKTRGGAGEGNAALEHAVAAAIQSHLPDYQLLVNTRARLTKLLSETQTEGATSASASAVEVEPPLVEEALADDFDFNIEGAEDAQVSAVVKAELAKLPTVSETGAAGGATAVYDALYVLVLELVEVYLDLSPQSVTAVKFDLLRLLDETVVWEAGQSEEKALRAVHALPAHTLTTILRVLRLATERTAECRWCGTAEDATKMLINLIVAEDWQRALKRTVLMKLMLLCSAEDEEVARRARSLLKLVFIQSGLFVGHGLVDYELNTEMSAWLDPAALRGESLLVLEVVLRLAQHWNTPLSIQAAERSSASYLMAVGSPLAAAENTSLVPFSPVLYCSLLLAGVNFEVFAASLPKHIRTHIHPDGDRAPSAEGSFFDKYRAQFRAAVERVAARVVVAAVPAARSAKGMAQALNGAWEVVGFNNTSGGLGKLLTQFRQLLEATTTSMEAVAQECPTAFRDALDAKTAPVGRSAKKKPIKASSAETEATSEHDDFVFASKCAALVTRWSAMGALVGSDSDRNGAVQAFADEHWWFLLKLALECSETPQSMGASHAEWAQRMWWQEVAGAGDRGAQSKLTLVQRAVEFQLLLESRGLAQFEWSDDDQLLVARRAEKKSNQATPARSSRKRTQSDLSADQSSDLSEVLLPLCKAVTDDALALVTATANSSLLPTILVTDAALHHVASPSWLGVWLRQLVGRAVASRHLVARKAVNTKQPSDGAATVWSALVTALKSCGLKLRDGAPCAALHAIGSNLVKLVHSPELRSLLLDQALPGEVLAQASALKSVATLGTDGPSLALLDRMAEDGIRSSSLSHLATAAETGRGKEAQETSPLSCPLFRYGTAESEPFYLDLRSMGKSAGLNAASFTDKLQVAARALYGSSDNVQQLLYRVFSSAQVSESSKEEEETTRFPVLSDLCDALAAKADPALHLSTLTQLISRGAHFPQSEVLQALGLQLSRASAPELWALFVEAACEVFVAAVDSSLEAIGAATVAGLTQAARAAECAKLADRLATLSDLVELRVADCPQGLAAAQVAATKKKLNKLAKSAMKNGVEIAAVLQWLRTLLVTLQGDSAGLLIDALRPTEEDFYHASTLFELVPTHSKFSLILCSNKDGAHPAKEQLLALVLLLARHKAAGLARPKSSNLKKRKREETPPQPEQYLTADAVLAGYGGSLSTADRLALRILTVLNGVDLCPALCTLHPRTNVGSCSILTSEGLRSADELLAESAKWVVEGISPPVAYATLARFPMWRTLDPQPVVGLEGDVAQSDHNAAQVNASTVDTLWKATDTKGGADDASQGDADEADEEGPAVDLLHHCSEKVMDPAFYLPVFLHVLRNREVSIRQMANSGALSLAIAALGSPCASLRTYALACLQFVVNMLEQQTPTRDAAFRERAQLSLLLHYLRNSFDTGSAATSAPRLPLTTAIFLGRASMNVMQPSHELFGRVNKYLLSRPFCDVKDVPLYDLLLVNGDAQSDQLQRLAALRLFRDGLQTKQDHLNLCRKNAYNRLMLLFPLIAKDVRAGHAILDLLERGMSLRFSARYLLERCLLAPWLKLLASPMGAMQLNAAVGSDTVATNSTSKHDEADSTSSLTHYSKYLVRALTMLRRVIASSYLLAVEDAACVTHLHAAHTALTAVAWDAVRAIQCGYADSIPADYFVQLVLCMWDLSGTLSKASGAADADKVVWQKDLLWAVSQAIAAKFPRTAGSRVVTVNADELQVSLLTLAARGGSHLGAANVDQALAERLRHASCAYLLGAKEPAVDALAITSAAEPPGYETVVDARHVIARAVMDKATALPYYTNVCDYHTAELEADGVNNDPQHCLSVSWTVAAGAELSQMTALPTTLGRPFTAALVTGALGVLSGSDGLSPTAALDTLRWLLIVRNGFAHSEFRSSTGVLASGRVMARLTTDLGLSLHSSLVWLQLAAPATIAGHATLVNAHSAAHDVVSKLKSVYGHIQETATAGEITAGCHQHSELSDALFDYLSLLVTLCDHPSARGAEHASLRSVLNAKAARVIAACSQPGWAAKQPSAAGAVSIQDLVQSVSTAEFRYIPGLVMLDAAAVCLPQGVAARQQSASRAKATRSAGVDAAKTNEVDADDAMVVEAEEGGSDSEGWAEADSGDEDEDPNERSVNTSAFVSAYGGEEEDEEQEDDGLLSMQDSDEEGSDDGSVASDDSQ